MQQEENILAQHIESWNLVSDGNSFYTHSSLIQPVLSGETKCVLKVLLTPEEKAGSKVQNWWNGISAAKVFCMDDDAILMERIIGDRSLKSMSLNNQDEEATEIICNVANLLHSCNKGPFPQLVPLEVWFKELFLSAGKYGDIFLKSANQAKVLLAKQKDITVLHGDLHHDNILYSSDRGWLAIDPKGLHGDRSFDYVNILCNPIKEIALEEGRLIKQIDIISKNAGIETKHILEWTVAWAGLSAVWFLNDNQDATLPVGVLEYGLAQL